jgi:hypothetical protein
MHAMGDGGDGAAGTLQAPLGRVSALSGTPGELRTLPPKPTPAHAHIGDHDEAVPFSSSFFAGRLLKVLHHDVRSRLADAGSGVWTAAGWGSPLRTRGVCELLCMLGLGIADGLKSVAALQRMVSAGEGRGQGAVVSRCPVLSGQKWVGGRSTGPRRHSEREGHGAGGHCTGGRREQDCADDCKQCGNVYGAGASDELA